MPSIVTVGAGSHQHSPAETQTAAPGVQKPPERPQSTSMVAKRPEPVVMRSFGDSHATRDAIYANIFKAAQGIQPVSNSRYSLEVADPHWAEEGGVSIAERKRAVLRGETLQRRLRGTWRLKDNKGNLIGERKTTLAHVPKLTNQGTFVINGSEYTLGHQKRLRPGVFTRRKENGELESHINVMPGKGLSHHYFMEPETGVFKARVHQSNIPLINVLRAMGATDKELRKEWGDELFNVNVQKDDPKAIDKIYAKLIGSKGNPKASHHEKREAVAAAFAAMELDPEVTKRTLGKPYHRFNKDAALATVRKLLAVSRGHADTDDRDSLIFQHFMGPEDLFAERMDRGKRVLNELLWKASTKGDVNTIPTGAFTSHVHAALLDSGLGQTLEEINPADVFDQQHRVSRLGYGGIPSIDSVPDEARAVQPSHLGYVDLLRTPESFKVGVDSRMSYVSKKGSDGRIYTPFIDPKKGDTVYRSPQDVADLTVAFPGEMEKGSPLVAAQVGGKTRYVDRNKVDLVMPHAEHWFSPMNNLVPGKSAVKGQRAAMASRMITQALPLKGAEAPLVRSQVPGDPNRSFEEHFGHHMGAVHAERQPGRVVDVNPDGVTIRYHDGTTKTHETYNNFPYNRKTYLHNTAMVKPGDPVGPGQLLARSNYTDDTGHFALGKNLRVAYVPFRGKNYEDAYVISASAAKKLSSEHMYQHNLDWDDKHRKGKNKFVSIFPGAFGKDKLKNIDTDGVIQPGTKVQPGDPLVLAAKERELSRKQVHAAHKGSFVNETLTWDHHDEGVVTDVEKTKKGVTVAVKSLNQMQIGDKLSGRYGDKGVIADIIPDDQMPHDGEGKHYEVLANPLGIISRTNPMQKHEATLGAIAEKTGKPYILNDFSDINDLNDFVLRERARHGVNNYKDIHDPGTGQRISNVFTGNRFFMKLHHTSESKGQGRGLGGYTAEGMPAKGGVEGSKRMALMDVNAMISHGALETLRDVKLIRGQKNQEYWTHFRAGNRPPTPRPPIVYEKFINQLKASGINVQREGSQNHLMEMTDKQINDHAGDRELENVETVDWRSGMAPVKGGLFDEKLTGGHNGNRWAKITLHEPMPNPVMEEPIRRVLGITKDRFENVLAGKEKLGDEKGPKAIGDALARIDLPKAIEQAKADIASGRRTARDTAVKKLQHLKAAQMKGVHPKEWMVSAVPVLPPAFRPVSIMGDKGTRLISDANFLYKEVFDANKALRDVSQHFDDTSDERLTLYKAFKGVTGLGDPVHPKNRQRNVKGFLKQIFGSSPKFGTVQQKLIGTTVDLVGRAVVTPNPDLNMDEVGLPENRAWEIYNPFIARRLVRRGVPRIRAMEYIQNRHDLAKKAMIEEINERPVIVTRAPVLHRYGLMAFWPKLTKGDTLHVSPLVVGGFNMDFDGDQSNYHVPASDAARDEAIDKLMPSKNLLSTQKFQAHYLPRQEYVGGLFNATKGADPKKRPRVFATKKDALRALERGEIKPDHPIQIINAER